MTATVPRLRPVAGVRYRHTQTGTVATYTGRITYTLAGHPLLVLDHPRFGECRWPPVLVEKFDPDRHEPDPHH